MNVFSVNLPEGLDLNEFELKMLFATKLYEQGKLSSGQAASIVGISKRTFVELLGKYGVSLFGQDGRSVVEDLENA